MHQNMYVKANKLLSKLLNQFNNKINI